MVFIVQKPKINLQSKYPVCYEEAIHNFTILKECGEVDTQNRAQCMIDKNLLEKDLDLFASSCQNFVQKS